MHKEIYINGMDWKRIKDDQGGLTLMVTFRDYFNKEDYIELIKRNYYFLTTKEEFEDLQEENKLLKEYYLKQVSKYEELIEKYSNLQERLDKATEYMNQLPFNDLVPLEVKVIKEILQGEDNE